MKRLLLVVVAAAIAFGFVSLIADDDEYEYRDKRKYSKEYKYNKRASRVAKMPQIYIDECASCHMGYQAEFLPKRSWIKMMKEKSLEDHFGTDATLEPEDSRKILDYLVKNAADSKPVGKYYNKIARSIRGNESPLAISETRYFKKEHREIPKRLITQKEVKSIANCMACHTTADKGQYGDRWITIPNYGKWDD